MCAADCKSGNQRLECNCGAICCMRCYGLTGSSSVVSGYQCDTCRTKYRGSVAVHPRQDFYFCRSCRSELQQTPGKDVQSLCPDCRCRFCQKCAALALSESAKRSSEGEFAVSLRCPICAGSTQYQAQRVAVCNRLLKKVLGSAFQTSAQITQAQLDKGKASADELGDLLYDCFFNGFRDAFDECFPPFLEVVSAQLRLKQAPSADPFHLLYYMGQNATCTTVLLAHVCRAQAEDALKGSESGPLWKRHPCPATEPLLHERPSTLRVTIYGSDVVQNSPTADLVLSVFEHWHSCLGESGDRLFEFFLLADGPVDDTHPPAAEIKRLFGNRLILFSKRTSAKTKYDKILETQPHILLTLTGWTHGHIAEIIATVARGPLRVLVFSWLGFAGLMCMKEAVHFTVLGQITGSQRQLRECETFRERVAVVSCYQPAQSHPTYDPSHWKADSSLPVMSRTYFNLPSSETHFIFVFPGTLNRIVEDTLTMWLEILARVENSCLILLKKPAHMQTTILTWIDTFNGNAAKRIDPARVLWRPYQKKTYFLGLLHAVGEDGAGVSLDSVQPISIHTTANDSCLAGTCVMSYRSEYGFQSRVVWELMKELGLEQQCIAPSRDEFVEHVVQFVQNRQQLRAIREYLLRTCRQRVLDAKLPKELLRIFEHGHAMFRTANGDSTKLTDFDVSDLSWDGKAHPPIPLFVDSPEFAALSSISCAGEADPDRARRNELLQIMLDKGLHPSMKIHALKIMSAHQMKGLRLDSVLGAGAFSIVISATAVNQINSCVPPGTRVALKLSKEGVPVGRIKNHSLGREGMNMALLESRLVRTEFHDMIPAPIFVWGKGRSFWGHTDLDQTSMIFLCQELIDECCFHDVMKPFGEKWRKDAVIDESFQYMVLRPLFRLAYELRHTASLAIMDIKPSNMACRSANSHMTVWDLGNASLFSKPTDHTTHANAGPVPLSRNATGSHAKSSSRQLRGLKDSSDLFTVSNQQVRDFCRTLNEQGKGLGRCKKGTFGYCDPAPLYKENDTAFFARDIFAIGRSVLKCLSYDQRKLSLGEWDDKACEAARNGWEGIQGLIEGAVDPPTQTAQRVTVERISKLLAGVLHPDPEKRMTAKDAMLHQANTLPFFCRLHSLALTEGTGVSMAGGLVESMAVPFRDHPHLKGRTLPPVDLLLQHGMGVGVKLRKALKKDDVACVYGGDYYGRAGQGLCRAYPSRYCVSSFASKNVTEDNGFICDGAPSAKRPIAWFIDNNVAGPFMNGRNGEGLDINCNLDRNSAWQDGNGDVFFVLTANKDIEEGEWLMWKYDWQSGSGVAMQGLTFSFD
jgi:serine/threonine protein kinase